MADNNLSTCKQVNVMLVGALLFLNCGFSGVESGHNKKPRHLRNGAFQYLVRPSRFELPTSAMSRQRSNQLS